MQNQVNGFFEMRFFIILLIWLQFTTKVITHSRHCQHLLKNGKKNLDNKGSGGPVLIDLSKPFDTINHDLLIEKSNAYGYEHEALKLTYSYLINRQHRTKMNATFSSWKGLT